MDQQSQKMLAFPKIMEQLATYCAFSASRELARALLPSDDGDTVRHRLALTTEARQVLDLRPDIGVHAREDVRPAVRMAMRGVMLSPEQLLAIQTSLASAASLNAALRAFDNRFPLLCHMGSDLPLLATVIKRIDDAITAEGSVRDSVNPELRDVRGQIRLAQQGLQNQLQALVTEFGPALQEATSTMRAGRYVLPVRAEARAQVRGIVHDQSASGATVFIEPLVIIEMNNRLRELELNEHREVERILLELSGEVAKEALSCILAVELLAEIDLHFAKARYSQAIKGNPAQINERGIVELVDARHPLLTGTVVPLNIHLGDTCSMVVITGPNTGGKTVALTTVGLLVLMTAAGLHIPADARSQIPIFRDVFVDIGDEQSLEQNLSTFSAHLSRIIAIVQQAGPGALILLDELGAGTDPHEGAALAQALVKAFLEGGVLGVITTHFADLVVFAEQTPSIENAAMLFDASTLRPTYQLQMGISGSSFALAIAAHLGMPVAIVADARAILTR